MKLKKNYISTALIGAFLLFNLACGGSSTTSSNANNSNTNSAPKDMSPVTVTADEFRTKENIGRPITITGVELVGIYSTSLEFKANMAEIKCDGDFSSYMSSADRIKELRLANKSPKATIKGVYKEYENGKAVIKPCVMSDLEK